jgi:hypothetical protein
VKDKMSGDTPYQVCEPEVLGFTASVGSAVAPQAVQAVQQERIWSPMLFQAIGRGDAHRLIADGRYFAQRKMDGNRMRLFAPEDGVVRACNRKGQELPVPMLIRQAGSALFGKVGPFDLDGESMGNNEFHAFDALHVDPNAPARERVTFLLGIAGFFPDGICPVPTALTSEAKEAMLQRAIDEGWEGLMFKRQEAPYAAGRSPRTSSSSSGTR